MGQTTDLDGHTDLAQWSTPVLLAIKGHPGFPERCCAYKTLTGGVATVPTLGSIAPRAKPGVPRTWQTALKLSDKQLIGH